MIDIDKINRENFKSLLNALSRPGDKESIQKVFDSYLSGAMSVLLFCEVKYHNATNESLNDLEVITNVEISPINEADYLACDSLDGVFDNIKKGSFDSPEFSCTIIYKSKFDTLYDYTLTGPGIDGKKDVKLPINRDEMAKFIENNSVFPIGNELIFLNETNGEIQALSRTTKVEKWDM